MGNPTVMIHTWTNKTIRMASFYAAHTQRESACACVCVGISVSGKPKQKRQLTSGFSAHFVQAAAGADTAGDDEDDDDDDTHYSTGDRQGVHMIAAVGGVGVKAKIR